MSANRIFCEECRDDVSCIIVDEQKEATIKGETYLYMGRTAYCSECNSELYIPEVNDYNLDALYDKHRESHGIVTREEVRSIPEKYAIGKRPLSRLLGWGELTFSRYYDGDIPTKQYSDIIQRLYREPAYYEHILESNKERISRAAYNKSKKAIENIINASLEKKPKIDVCIDYLLHKCEDITPLALQKALYYIQGFYYAFNREFIFSEDCQAWVHGPVYVAVYQRYKDYKFDPIKSLLEFDESLLSSIERDIYESVSKHICCYSGKVLERFTHSEMPWLLARKELSESDASNRVITKESIGTYFDNVKDKYNMIIPNDIKDYAQAMFQHL